MNENKGMSLLEVIISTVLLAFIVAGLVNLFVFGKRYILHNRAKMTGGMLGSVFLDNFPQQFVRMDTWYDATNCLGPNSTCSNIATRGKADGLDRDYTATYTIDTASLPSNLHRVTVNLKWNE